jgi:hypothetical protein
MICKICGNISTEIFEAILLRKYKVTYYNCSKCGFLQTEDPYWLEEAYLNLNKKNSDIGAIQRNLINSRIVSAVIRLCLDNNSHYVDYGGGYGVFVRLMRDRGYNFFYDDKYNTNIFASGFDIADSNIDRFNLLTAFEVFEHFVSPCEELDGLLQKSDNILFSTEILQDIPPHPDNWWYYSLSSGQHISFYTKRSLRLMADKFNLKYYSRNNMHLFMRNKFSFMKQRFLFATDIYISKLIQILFRKKSLINSDYKQITGVDIN